MSKLIRKSNPLDDWVKTVKTTGCKTCRNKPATETIRQLLNAMIRQRASHITLRDILAKTKAIHENYAIGTSGLRTHLNVCEKKLYRKARGYDE